MLGVSLQVEFTQKEWYRKMKELGVVREEALKVAQEESTACANRLALTWGAALAIQRTGAEGAKRIAVRVRRELGWEPASIRS